MDKACLSGELWSPVRAYTCVVLTDGAHCVRVHCSWNPIPDFLTAPSKMLPPCLRVLAHAVASLRLHHHAPSLRIPSHPQILSEVSRGPLILQH